MTKRANTQKQKSSEKNLATIITVVLTAGHLKHGPIKKSSLNIRFIYLIISQLYVRIDIAT